jgi:hypothetical protein
MVQPGPLPFRPPSPRNTYGIPQPAGLRPSSNKPIGSTVVLTCPSAIRLNYKKPPPKEKYGVAVLQDNIVEPIEPPSNKPFVEQDLEKLRNTTAGVAWKLELKMYERKNTIRPVQRLEEMEVKNVRDFLVSVLHDARAEKKVVHTLAPGKQADRGFDIPGGGLWVDTVSAMNEKRESAFMSDQDIEDCAAGLMSKLDIRKPEDLLFLTESDWCELRLPVNLAWLRDRLLRLVMTHDRVPAMQRASFWAAQQMSQRPIDRFKTMNFADPKTSCYSSDGYAIPEEALLKGRQQVVPPTKEGRGWVKAECLVTREMPRITQDKFNRKYDRTGSLPNLVGWPRGWPYRGTDMGPEAHAYYKKNHEDRGTQEWRERMENNAGKLGVMWPSERTHTTVTDRS